MFLLTLDGPNMTKRPGEYSVLEGYPIELICGENLDSNPEATVVWSSPQGEKIKKSNENYIMSNSPSVALRLKNVTRSDHNGAWICTVKVEGNATYCPDPAKSRRTLNIEIQLIVVGMLKNECCPLLDMYF